MDSKVLSALIPFASDTSRFQIADTLDRFGEPILSFVAAAGATICPLHDGQRFDEASPTLKRLGVDVDTWPAPPSGLFVVEERCVYLRSRSAMTIAHDLRTLLTAR